MNSSIRQNQCHLCSHILSRQENMEQRVTVGNITVYLCFYHLSTLLYQRLRLTHVKCAFCSIADAPICMCRFGISPRIDTRYYPWQRDPVTEWGRNWRIFFTKLIFRREEACKETNIPYAISSYCLLTITLLHVLCYQSIRVTLNWHGLPAH